MSVIPTCLSYDPAYVYEMAVILQNGMKRMYENGEDVFYYITMYNEDYPMPEMPKGVEEGIVRGIYPLQRGGERQGSGAVAGQRADSE